MGRNAALGGYAANGAQGRFGGVVVQARLAILSDEPGLVRPSGDLHPLGNPEILKTPADVIFENRIWHIFQIF